MITIGDLKKIQKEESLSDDAPIIILLDGSEMHVAKDAGVGKLTPHNGKEILVLTITNDK